MLDFFTITVIGLAMSMAVMIFGFLQVRELPCIKPPFPSRRYCEIEPFLQIRNRPSVLCSFPGLIAKFSGNARYDNNDPENF